MNNNKTQRKNKTNQVIIWPKDDVYFSIKDLTQLNPHMVTSSKLDITLRVRLNKALTENKVAMIGYKNAPKGRPQLIFAVRPIKQCVLDQAKADNINIIDQTKTVSIMKISPVLGQTATKQTSTAAVTNIIQQQQPQKAII